MEQRGFALGLLSPAASGSCLDISGCTGEGASGTKLKLLQCIRPGMGFHLTAKRKSSFFYLPSSSARCRRSCNKALGFPCSMLHLQLSKHFAKEYQFIANKGHGESEPLSPLAKHSPRFPSVAPSLHLHGIFEWRTSLGKLRHRGEL